MFADEEDIFDADFESTDDEAQADDTIPEVAAQEEEKRARKARVLSTARLAHLEMYVTGESYKIGKGY